MDGKAPLVKEGKVGKREKSTSTTTPECTCSLTVYGYQYACACRVPSTCVPRAWATNGENRDLLDIPNIAKF